MNNNQNKDAIVWFRENIVEEMEIYPDLLKLLRKIGVSKGYRYIIWDRQKFPLKYVGKNEKIVMFDYGNKIGSRYVRESRERYLVEGMDFTVIRYNHFKQGFAFSHIEFNSKMYSAFDTDNK